MVDKQEFSKYERARILGARALQISMDAPLLMKIDEKDLENLNYDPLKIAMTELDSGVLPISVNRPLPMKKDEKLKELKVEELEKDEEKEKQTAEKEEAENEEGQAEVVQEQKQQETADLKSDEEVEEEIEEVGGAAEISGADGDADGGSDE